MRQILTLGIIGFVFSVVALAADLTGTWTAEVELDIGSGSPTFVLKQSGEQITGTYSGALGESKVKGTIKDDHVELMFDSAPSGETVTAVYSGTVTGPGKMKGTVKIGSMASGTFTATKN